MTIKHAVFAMACFVLAAGAIAQPSNPSPPGKTLTGATFAIPDVWTSHVEGPVSRLDPPETDTHLAIVDVGQSADGKSAAAAAWKIYQPSGARPFKLLTSRPPRDGWDEQVVIDYEISPAEHRSVSSVARRKGTMWTVAIIDGSESTLEKREGAVDLVVASLRPAGFVRESFAGRTAHPLTPARVTALLDFVRHSADELGVPGVGVALIDHGRIVHEGGVGVREMGKAAPVDSHTLFMIASNTKSMSTLLLAELVDEGKLRWDEPVIQAYPSFRLGSEATTRKVLIRHLVCACTGLPSKDFEWSFTTTASTPAAHTFDLLAATEPTSDFGELFQYSNLMAAAGGYIAAHLVHPELEIGAAYDATMQEKIFDPLGMHESTLSMARALATVDHASPHGKDVDGNLHLASLDTAYAVVPFRPQGSVWSSPHDMILYVRNELTEGLLPNGRRLVSAKNLRERRQRGVPLGEDQWYGMGLAEDATWGVSFIDHGGDLPGYHSDFFVVPSAQVGAVILTNSENGYAMTRPFIRRLFEILYDGHEEAAEDLKAKAEQMEAERVELRRQLDIPPTSADLAQLASVYTNPELGTLTVDKGGGTIRFRTNALSSALAPRHNEDGTTSFLAVEPGLAWLVFVAGTNSGARTLITGDSQHTYVYTEVATAAAR